MNEDKSYKEILKDITTIILDVDGVLTDSTITITTDGEMLRKMNIKDGYALKTAVTSGFNLCIISGGTNEGVKKRLEGLGIKAVFLGAHQKTDQLYSYLNSHDIKLDEVLYMGDDIPDIPVLKMVALPCCPQDAVPEVKVVSKYISHKKGGEGCVRDVIEQVLKIHGKWYTDFDAQAF